MAVAGVVAGAAAVVVAAAVAAGPAAGPAAGLVDVPPQQLASLGLQVPGTEPLSVVAEPLALDPFLLDLLLVVMPTAEQSRVAGAEPDVVPVVLVVPVDDAVGPVVEGSVDAGPPVVVVAVVVELFVAVHDAADAPDEEVG